MIFSEGFSKTGFQKVLKRVFDISVSVVMLVATAARHGRGGTGIWHETGRPIPLSSKKGGESGRIFEILKFRSMRVEAEHDGVRAMGEERRRTR